MKDKPSKRRSTAGSSSEDIDVDVLRSLVSLTSPDVSPFHEHELPPAKVRAWINQANLPQTHGLLICALRQWHKLRRQEPDQKPDIE